MVDFPFTIPVHGTKKEAAEPMPGGLPSAALSSRAVKRDY